MEDVVHVWSEFIDQSLGWVWVLSWEFFLTFQNPIHPWCLLSSNWMICKKQIVQALDRFIHFKLNLSILFLVYPILELFYTQLSKFALNFMFCITFCWIWNLFWASVIVKVLEFLQYVNIQFIWISCNVLVQIFKIQVSVLTISRFVYLT